MLIIGALLLAPVSIVVAGTEVFYLPHVIVLCSGIWTLLRPSRIRRLRINTLDQLVIAYALWILFAFFANVALSVSEWSSDENFRRAASLFMACSMLLSYLMGRAFGGEIIKSVRSLFGGIAVTFMLSCSHYLLMYKRFGINDLFLAREVMGQRLPFIVCFVATLLLVLSIWWKQYRFAFWPLSIVGFLLVALSLTRAAYLQCIFSVLAVVAYLGYFRPRRTLIVLILLGAGCVFLWRAREIAGYEGIQTIANRLEQIGRVSEEASSDASGNFRLAMWRGASEALNKNPIRWLIGFGELGASFAIKDIEFNYGIEEASSAHSQYVDVLVREGIVGLLFFLLIYGKVMLFKVRIQIEDGRIMRPVIFAHSVALIGVFVYGIFHETVRYPIFGFYFWGYAGVISGLSCVRSREKS